METPSMTPITVAHGDGIGPEIMAATLRVLDAAGAKLDIQTIQIGEQVYKQGHASGIAREAWTSIRDTGVLLKSPITTPQGGGYKSLNVTLRKTLGLFANIRPCVAYAPFVKTHHPDMNLVIVRENEEDLYAGIEHRQTREVTQCLKLITTPGTQKIVRFAFDYAKANGRPKLTCLTKDNIMKLTDGLFHKVFDEIAGEYPEVQAEHMIIDIGAARLADVPERFEVVVTANLYGDIVSDIAAEVSGSVGLCPSANIGDHAMMFEAIHGSAPDIAGQDIANPSGLLLAALKMLKAIGQGDVAATVQNAWLCTIEQGIHTADIHEADSPHSKQLVGTSAFADAVIQRLGQTPEHLQPVTTAEGVGPTAPPPTPPADKQLVGVDVFLDWDEDDRNPDAIGAKLQAAAKPSPMDLVMITNRGQKVWPDGQPETFCTDHWRCRFQRPGEAPVSHRDVIDLLGHIADAGLDFIKTEHLCTFDGNRGYSLGQGQQRPRGGGSFAAAAKRVPPPV
jgi:isocitrate dehydrogenase